VLRLATLGILLPAGWGAGVAGLILTLGAIYLGLNIVILALLRDSSRGGAVELAATP